MKTMQNKSTIIIVLFLSFILFNQCKNQEKKRKGKLFKIETTLGDITIKLYNETPKHKDNFLKLVDEGYYNGLLFHRVIKDFMIQTGDPNSKTAKKGQMLGSGGPGYTIEAEFNSNLFHKKGALSAARLGDEANPEKRSSGSQFYIVQGKKYTDDELNQMESQSEINQLMPFVQEYIQDPQNADILSRIQELNQKQDRTGLDSLIQLVTKVVAKKHPEIKPLKFTAEQREVYKNIGGTPFLDGSYTVFGEVVEGLDVLDKIAAVKTNSKDRPVEDVKIISITAVKK
jgi:cyclophilin family peptidyl-prolyl cis-trans isomerase